MPPKRQEVTSQATPLSGDILEILRGQLSSGNLGLGVGPLGREAGTAARQFVSSGVGGRGGTEGFDLSPLLKQLEEIQNRRVGEQTGDLRESFGITGQRFGTALQKGEGNLRGRLEDDFLANIGNLLRQSFESQQQRTLFGQGQQLQGINLLGNIGQQNLAPFLNLAALGINPDIFTENPFVTGGKLGAELIGAVSGVKGAPGGQCLTVRHH